MEEYDGSDLKFSATDTTKMRIINYIFNLCNKACTREEPVAEYGYETGFTRGVRLVKSMLWKYMHPDIKQQIKNLYTQLEYEIKQIDMDERLSEENKRLNKQKKADEVAIQILEICLVVLQYSPMNTEFKEMELFEDFEELAKKIRTREPIKLFSSGEKK